MDNEASNLMCVEFINLTTLFSELHMLEMLIMLNRDKNSSCGSSLGPLKISWTLPYEICKALWVAAKIHHFCARCSLELESF